jgi:hypothetical protein
MRISLSSQALGAGHYLDHAATISTWAGRITAVAYPGMVATQMAHNAYQAPTAEDKKNSLQNDALRLGLPTLATWGLTQVFMPNSNQQINTPNAALQYFEAQHQASPAWYQQAQQQAQRKVKAWGPLAALLWPQQQAQAKVAQPLQHQLQQAELTPLLDVQVAALVKQHQRRMAPLQHAPATVLYQRFEALQHAAENTLLERAHTVGELPKEALDNYKALHQWSQQHPTSTKALLEGLPQWQWPERLAEAKAQLFASPTQFHPNSKPNQAFNTLLHHELRLLLPNEENFIHLPSLRENKQWQWGNLKPVIQQTVKDFAHEAAAPFLLVGGLSVASGVASGLLANHLQKAPAHEDTHVIKEGLFQYIANIAMCGLGAGVGLLAANSVGFSRFKNPVGRVACIGGGLAMGITAGALIANPISERIGETLGFAPSRKHRKLEAMDVAYHLDDAPAAISTAGVQILKPLVPPILLLSALRAAVGYRNTPLAKPLAPTTATATPRQGEAVPTSTPASNQGPQLNRQA